MNASHSETPIESALAVVDVAVVAAGELAGLVVAGVVASLFVVDSDFEQPIINIATRRVRTRISDFDI